MMKPLIKIVREKQKTAKAKEKIHRKAVKSRRKKIEKRVNGLLTMSWFLVCLGAAFWEANENAGRSSANGCPSQLRFKNHTSIQIQLIL